jgi:hypothetical protein
MSPHPLPEGNSGARVQEPSPPEASTAGVPVESKHFIRMFHRVSIAARKGPPHPNAHIVAGNVMEADYKCRPFLSNLDVQPSPLCRIDEQVVEDGHLGGQYVDGVALLHT